MKTYISQIFRDRIRREEGLLQVFGRGRASGEYLGNFHLSNRLVNLPCGIQYFGMGVLS